MRHIIRRTAGLFCGCLLFLSAEATAAGARTRPGGRRPAAMHRRTGMPRAPGMSETPSAQKAHKGRRERRGTARPAAWSRIRRAWRAGLRADTVSRGAAARRRASAYRTGYDTGYRNGYAAGYRAALDQTKNKPQPLPRYCPPSPRTRPAAGGGSSTASARNSARSTFPRRTSFSQGPTWRANRSALAGRPPALFVPLPPRVAPRLHLRRRIPGIGVSYMQAFGNRGEIWQPVAVYLFRARASHASARWYRSTTSGISACRSDGNPTTNYNRANIMMGSRVNAYLNVDFYSTGCCSRSGWAPTGLSMTHFSNGNTKFPTRDSTRSA